MVGTPVLLCLAHLGVLRDGRVAYRMKYGGCGGNRYPAMVHACLVIAARDRIPWSCAQPL
jgi:hypothetical protein